MSAQPANGTSHLAPDGSVASDDTLSKIHQALDIVHSSFSSNTSRRDAQNFLESVKALDEAPFQGYTLASKKSQSPIVRHYALSLIEHAIKHKWTTYTDDQARVLRGWVLELCQVVSSDDPIYLRNKTAQLWVETAKRSWAADWMDMDNLLVAMWEQPDSLVHKELVMFVLGTLSDEVFNGDDPMVAMREGVLKKACVEIFTPASVLSEAFPNRQTGPNVRCGDEGWLSRLSVVIDQCLNSDLASNISARTCAAKAFNVLFSLMPWIIPKAVAISGCVSILQRGLSASDLSVQKASLEAMHAFYGRMNFTDSEFIELVSPMFEPGPVDLYRRLLEWATLDAEDIDDEKYQFLKKFSEMLSYFGIYLNRKFASIQQTADVDGFLRLLLLVAQNQSLVVSIPVMVSWSRFLSNRFIGPRAANSELIGPLLELCSSRQLRYENLPEDSHDPTFLFLMEDTDNIPERHALLGNYRRYASQIIEAIVQMKLADAFYHILQQTEEVLRTLYDGQPPLEATNYSKYSMPVLRVDAHFTVIEAALKGYVKWRAWPEPSSQETAETVSVMEKNLEEWCNKLLQMNLEDPQIRKRILQLLVAFSTTALDKNSNFMLKVLEHILLTWPTLRPEHRAYNDSIKDLQAESMVELQRLASKMPDHLLDVYGTLEARVNEMIQSGSLDEKRTIAYQSFLFIIIHRATRIDLPTKIERLRSFIDPVRAQWQTPEALNSVSSFSSFCGLIGLDKAQQYLMSHSVHRISDWGTCELDAEGLALQADLEERLKLLPLRTTKSFLSYSVERIDRTSPAFEASTALWRDSLPSILPLLLQYLSHAHAAHDPTTWTGLPEEMRPVVGRVLSDRFWQAGISEGSKDEFYARVVDKKNTLEGLGSTIRGSVRFVRETCYSIIYCLSRFDTAFYGFHELPSPLAQALFQNSVSLSTHQQTNILNLARYLVDDCSVEHREHFLPPLLAACFRQMDVKINAEWEKLANIQTVEADGDALTEEMKAESILRQVTYNAVLMVADFLDPTKMNPAPKTVVNANATDHPRYPSLRKFCLMHLEIVEPLLLFCTHAIRMRDTRCCGIILRVFRSIIPEFSAWNTGGARPQEQGGGGGEGDSPANGTKAAEAKYTDSSPLPEEIVPGIREYISSDVLKACISSFNETYFVDIQKELAALIAAIVVHYSSSTQTPSTVLLSLPNVQQEDLEKLGPFMAKPLSHSRQQRTIVLEMLKDLKGVSVAEMGKLPSVGIGGRAKKSGRTKMVEEFMKEPAPGNGGPEGGSGIGMPDEALEGVAGLFGGH